MMKRPSGVKRPENSRPTEAHRRDPARRRINLMSWFRRLLSSVKGNNTEQAALLRRRGDELAAEGSLVEAAAAYDESIKLGGFDRAAYLKLAEFYFDAYQPQEARETLRRLVAAAPDDGETYRALIKVSL